MLQVIREHIQGWIAGVIIFILAAAFVLWGLQYYINESSGTQAPVAKVDGQKISQQQLNQAFQRLQRVHQSHSAVPLNSMMRKELKQLALQQLITQIALVQSARKSGLFVSPSQVEQLVMVTPQFQVNGKFSQAKFQQLLFANSLSQAAFFQRVEQQALTEQMQGAIQVSSFTLPNELKQMYFLFNQRRDFGYFVLPSSRFLKTTKVSSSAVKNFYQQNKNLFKTPSRVQVSYISLSPTAIKQQVKISETEMKNFYNTNIANYSLPKRWQIRQYTLKLAANMSQSQINIAKTQLLTLSRKLDTGASFTVLKKHYSNLEMTTQWLTADQVSGSLQTLLTSLSLKQISSPFRSQNGMSIIQLLLTQASKVRPFSSVSDSVKKALLQQKIEAVLTEKGDKLTNLAYTNPTTLTVAAKATALPIQFSKMFPRQGLKKGVFSNPNVLSAVFSNSVFKQKNNSTPIALKNGGMLILRVSKYQAGELKSFATVSEKIGQMLRKKMAQRRAGLWAYNIQKALEKGSAIDKLQKQYKINWHTEKNVQRDSKLLESKIVAAAFSHLPASNSRSNSVAVVLLSSGDYAIVQTLQVHPVDFSKISTSAKELLKTNIQNFLGQLDYRFYIKSVTDNANIKRYKEI